MPTPSNASRPKKPAAPRKRAATPAQTKPEYGAGWGSPVEDVRMPSGTLAQLRRPGVTGLVAAKVIDNVDSLSDLVVKEHVDRARGKRPAKPKVDPKILQDAKAMADIMTVMHKIAAYAVIRPSVIRPIRMVGTEEQLVPWAEREPLSDGVIWVDQIPEEDLAFIVNYAVGGTRDLAQFRKESDARLGMLNSGQGIQL